PREMPTPTPTGTPTINVNELADAIRKPEVEKGPLIERLRYWTAQGLLETVGELNPGSGRERAYDPDIIFLTAILDSLNNFGLQVGKLRAYGAILDRATQARAAWVKDPRTRLMLEIADLGPDQSGRQHFVFLHRGKAHGHPYVGTYIHGHAETGLVLNLT